MNKFQLFFVFYSIQRLILNFKKSLHLEVKFETKHTYTQHDACTIYNFKFDIKKLKI